jgi:hypothetical protein
LALNFMGTVMSCFFTVNVSYDVLVSLGMSIPHEVRPLTAMPSISARIKAFFFL